MELVQDWNSLLRPSWLGEPTLAPNFDMYTTLCTGSEWEGIQGRVIRGGAAGDFGGGRQPRTPTLRCLQPPGCECTKGKTELVSRVQSGYMGFQIRLST